MLLSKTISVAALINRVFNIFNIKSCLANV